MPLDVEDISPAHPDAQRLLAAYGDELGGLYGRDFSGTEAPAITAIEGGLAAPSGRFLMLYDEGKAVACGGVRRLGDGTGEIKRMYVVPNMRSRGVGRRLLDELENAARDLGYSTVRLDTGPRQPEAKKLYEKTGYSEIPRYNELPLDGGAWFEKVLSN